MCSVHHVKLGAFLKDYLDISCSTVLLVSSLFPGAPLYDYSAGIEFANDWNRVCVLSDNRSFVPLC